MKANKTASEERQKTVERGKAWGAGLRSGYGDPAKEQLPDKFLDLLKQLEDAESRQR